MSNFVARFRVVLAAAVFGLTSVAIAELPAGWSEPTVAHQAVRVTSAHGETVESRYHYAPPGKQREEMSREGMSVVMIVRQDLGVAWTFLPGNMYMEVSLEGDDGDKPYSAGTSGEGIVEFEELGPAEINGWQTTRYRVVTLEDGEEAEGYFWVTEHWIPVRMELWMRSDHGEKIITELRDLQIRDQPAELFEIPQGARKMPGFGFPGMPSGDAGGAGFLGELAGEAADSG